MSVTEWTGRLATTFQQAAHLSSEDFARRLDVSARTVARWHESPGMTPRPHLQQLLDGLLQHAPEDVQSRFRALTAGPAPEVPGALRVAIAVVTKGDDVLLVRRRTDTASLWQFPAGVVKPESSPDAAVVRETLAETGVDCAVRDRIGSRTHPKTGVFCVYLLCDYLAGEVENRDPIENDSVRWAPRQALDKFIPPETVYPPVRQLLQEPA